MKKAMNNHFMIGSNSLSDNKIPSEILERIKSDKELAAAKKLAKEQEERIAIELRKKEKEEFNNAKR